MNIGIRMRLAAGAVLSVYGSSLTMKEDMQIMQVPESIMPHRRELITAEKINTYTDIVYDTQSESQKLDLYLPAEGDGPFPLVFFIHGGGWFCGDKADGQESAWLTLCKEGYAVASVNYRLSPEAPHPAGMYDCKTALRWLKAHAGEYRIDPMRVASAGDSSGGQYALLMALTMDDPAFEDLTRGYPEQDTHVQCTVAWYPATDLSETMRTVKDGEYTGFGADFAWSNIERYIGKKIEDTADALLILVSPVTHVSAGMPPILLQHGDADDICPLDHSQRFYRAAEQTAGKDRVTLDIIPGSGHVDSAFETSENMIRVKEFLDAHLK